MKRQRLYLGISIALALLGFLITTYLTMLSLSGDVVAGCGGDSGCAEVLTSRWAKLGPIPVSLLGLLTYLAVLLGLGARMGSKGYSPMGDRLLWLAPPLLLVAAIWFTGVQIFSVNAICPFCMASHLIGFALACVLLIGVMRTTIANPKPPLFIGFLASGALILGQALLPPMATDPVRAPNPFANEDGDTWIDDARYVSLFGGQLQFVLQDVPYIGDPRAKHVVVVLFDYACPYCKTLHDMLDQAIADDPTRFVLVPIPVSIHEDHNPYIASDDERFEDSHDLARLSLAVAEIDPEQWQAFDRWLFATDEPDAFPRSYMHARLHAQSLVDQALLKEFFDAELMTALHEQVGRNISLLGQLPEDKRFIPVTTTPGGPEHLTTRFEDIEVLYELLESAETGQE